MKAPRIALVLAVSAVLALLGDTSSASGAPDELLVNGSFEEGADRWEEANCAFGLTSDSGLVLVGGFAAALTDTIEAGWVGQVVPVQPGATHSFSGWALKNDANIERVFLRIRWYARGDGFGEALSDVVSPLVTCDSDDYGSIAVTATAPAQAHSARVECVMEMVDAPTGPATAYFDGLSFTGPAPTTPTPTLAPTPSPTSMPAPTAEPKATSTPPPPPPTPATPTLAATVAPTPAASPTPTAGGTTAGRGDVLLNEIQYDPPQSGQDEHRFEWVELFNASGRAIEIHGWGLSDNVQSDPVPHLTLPEAGFAVVAASEGFFDNFPECEGTVVFVEDGRIGNGLNNEGDCLVLKDGSGNVIDAISYGDDSSQSTHHSDVAQGHSVERSPPGGGLVDNPLPTPGQGLYPAATPTPLPTPVPTPTPAPRVTPTAGRTPAGSEAATATPVASATPQTADGGASSGAALRAILLVAAIACLGIGFWARSFWARRRKGK